MPLSCWKTAAESTCMLLFLATIAGCGGAPGADPPVSARPWYFSDATKEAGLEHFAHQTGAYGALLYPEIMGSGSALVDIDGDGWLDIILVTGGTWSHRENSPPPLLTIYRNEKGGRFRDVTGELRLLDLHGYGQGIAAADYDGDGDLDLYVTTVTQNMLLRNDGDRFTEVGSAAGVAGSAEWSTSATFFDADRDGWLDLVVLNYVVWSLEEDLFCSSDGVTKTYCSPISYQGVRGRFYRNNGDGTFADATDAAGFGSMRGKGLGVAVIDLNRDGWPDLAIANDTEPDELYLNRGDGTFVEQGMLSGMAVDLAGNPRAGMGIVSGVVDQTGEETIFVGNFSSETMSVFRHQGNGVFTDRTSASGIGRSSLPALTFGTALFDVDLDGDLDLFVANGHIDPGVQATEPETSFLQPPQLYLNEGDGRFILYRPGRGDVLGDSLLARGISIGDFDRDGDPDVLLTQNGRPVRLLRNETVGSVSAEAGWLHLTLGSAVPSAANIGTRVRVYAGDERQERYVAPNVGYLSQSETAAMFGVGSTKRIDSLVVTWPSGRVSRFMDVVTPGRYLISDPDGELEVVPRAP